MRLVIINKRPYAVGLQWLSTTGKTRKRSMGELLKDATSLNPQLDLVAFRPSQHGFGSSGGNAGLWLKTSPLVAALRIPSISFIGMFLLEDVNGEQFWWVHASRQKLITAQGDNLFATREEAYNHVLGVQDLLGEFDQAISYDSVVDSTNWLSPLLKSEIIPAFSRGRLRPLRSHANQRKKLVAFLVGVGVVMAVSYGLREFLAHRAGQQAMDMARLALIDKEKHRKELLAHAARYFPTPWVGVLSVREIMSTCLPQMLNLPVAANGWTSDSAVCDGRTVKTTWMHHPGASYINLPHKGRLLTPQKAESSQLLKARSNVDSNPQWVLLRREEMSRLLYEITQTLGLKLKLSFEPPAKRVVDEVELLAPWVRGSFELSGLPAAFVVESEPVADMLSLQGLVLEQVRFSGTIWTFKGSVYANAN